MPTPFTQLFVHLVWATWDRLPMITTDLLPPICAAIAAKCTELRCRCIATGGVEDHIHVLVQCPPSIRVSELVGQLKGMSAHMVNATLQRSGSFRWQGSYGAFSISKRSVPRVSAYIQNRDARHGVHRLIPVLEQCSAPASDEL